VSGRGAVVVDTNVFSARLSPQRAALAERYEPMLVGRPAIISFQTYAEVLHGALRAGWGPQRRRRVQAALDAVETIWSGPELAQAYAAFRVRCEEVGHALGQRVHDGDRWIAATAVHLGVPVVTHDGVFRDAPGLLVETQLTA